jgi:hypothetical protein
MICSPMPSTPAATPSVPACASDSQCNGNQHDASCAGNQQRQMRVETGPKIWDFLVRPLLYTQHVKLNLNQERY